MCAKCDLGVWGSCIPSVGGGSVCSGSVGGVAGLVVLLELDGPAKGMALIERSGLAKSWGACDI